MQHRGIAEKGLPLPAASSSYLSREKNREDKFRMIFSPAVLVSHYVCSYIKKNGLFYHQIQTAKGFDIIFSFRIIF